MHASFAKNAKNAIALHAVAAKDASALSRKLPYLKASGFTGKEGELRLVPGRGGIAAAVLGLGLASTTRRAQASAERVSQELRGPGPPRTEAQPAGA